MCCERVASSEARHGRVRALRSRLAPSGRVLLGVWLALGVVTLAACEDLDGRDSGRSERFGPGRRDRDGWDRRDGRSQRHRPDGPDAVDAGADAGIADGGPSDAGAGDAGRGGAAADAGLGAGAADAAGGDVDSGAADAAILALSDGQIVAVADALLAGEIEQASAAEPLLSDLELLAFAEQTLAERQAARSTLASLATAIDQVAAPSGLADDVLAENAASLAALLVPDAGTVDAEFLGSRDAVHTRALERFEALGVAADAPALQGQLLVLQALERSALERVRELSGL